MEAELDDCKSFSLKHLPEEKPLSEWGIDELGEYARAQQKTIEESEQLATPSYWRLGRALSVARDKHLNHGQWGMFLNDLGIDKVRASRARAIYRTFESDQAVASLSVEQAYNQRQRKQKKPRRKKASPKGKVASLLPWLKESCRQATLYVDQAPDTAKKESETASSLIQELASILAKIQSGLPPYTAGS